MCSLFVTCLILRFSDVLKLWWSQYCRNSALSRLFILKKKRKSHSAKFSENDGCIIWTVLCHTQVTHHSLTSGCYQAWWYMSIHLVFTLEVKKKRLMWLPNNSKLIINIFRHKQLPYTAQSYTVFLLSTSACDSSLKANSSDEYVV